MKLRKYNNDPDIHGIIVQMPLDSVNPINSTLITDSVSSSKDVDGLNTENQGMLAVGDLTSGFLPCTPNGCMELIKRFLLIVSFAVIMKLASLLCSIGDIFVLFCFVFNSAEVV